MADLKVDFRDWLLKQGLAEKTKSGKSSTIYDYTITLDRVCKNEGHISWEELAVQIPSIIPKYQGKSKTVLRKYNTFLFETDIPNNISRQRNKNFLLAMMEDTAKEGGGYYTTDGLANFLRVTPRTVKRWRKNRVEQEKLDQIYENTDGKNPIGPKFTQIGGIYRYKIRDVKEYLRIE